MTTSETRSSISALSTSTVRLPPSHCYRGCRWLWRPRSGAALCMGFPWRAAPPLTTSRSPLHSCSVLHDVQAVQRRVCAKLQRRRQQLELPRRARRGPLALGNLHSMVRPSSSLWAAAGLAGSSTASKLCAQTTRTALTPLHVRSNNAEGRYYDEEQKSCVLTCPGAQIDFVNSIILTPATYKDGASIPILSSLKGERSTDRAGSAQSPTTSASLAWTRWLGFVHQTAVLASALLGH